ncbi:5-hydroxytryptamine receptor 3A-like isoform X2 [Gouania willdenowi]|nr:5-hydroxytryptamine receptor 3A-like isoform X2 [Gouania willdenowi]
MKELPTTSMPILLLIVFITALCSSFEMNCSEPTHPALLEALTPVFNLSSIRPVKNSSTTTNISVTFTLFGILGVDEKAQLLNTYIWLQYWWHNEFISWDPIECGTDKISLPKEKFWVPDIVINEFMNENSAPSVPYVYLDYDGWVKDAHPVKVVSSCNLDIYTFPFDIQNCTFTFNSYIHHARDIKIMLGVPVKNITERSKRVMTTLGEWELLDITFHDFNVDEYSIDEIAFHIRLRRRATLYVVNLLIPSIFLITVDLFSFLLPPQTIDRSSFKMTLILGYTVFLLIMNDLLPITGNSIPLINVFLSLCLTLMVASLVETILITNLLFNAVNFCSVPRWIQVLVLQIIGPIVFIPRKIKKSQHAGPQTTEATKGPDEIKSQAVESKAVQELKKVGKHIQAIRVQVEQQLGSSNPDSEDWLQCRPPKVKPSMFLFLSITLLLCVPPSTSAMLHCTDPSPMSLLVALQPVFELSAIRPVRLYSTPLNVTTDFVMYGILGVDEKAQLLTTYIWLTTLWHNEFVAWDPEECGCESISIPRNKIWVPDVVINEFMEKNSAPSVPYVYLLSNGIVMDQQPVRVVSSCRLDIYLFPFDIQNCTFSFNSYIHAKAGIDLAVEYSVESMYLNSKAIMATMGEWELTGIKTKSYNFVSGYGQIYEELRFFISVRRRSTLYVVNLLLPSCFLISLDLFSFILPPKSVDRSLFKMTLILGYTVFLLMMNDLLPVTGNTIPLINVFLCLCLALMVASLLETIIVTNLLRGSVQYQSPSRWVKVVFHFLGPLVHLPFKARDGEDIVIQNVDAQEMIVSTPVEDRDASKELLNEDEPLQELRTLTSDLAAIRLQLEKHLNSSKSTEEWVQVGLIIDRLLFILYILFITVSFITIITLWVTSDNYSHKE